LRAAADSALWTKVIFSYSGVRQKPQSLQYASHLHVKRQLLDAEELFAAYLGVLGVDPVPGTALDRPKIAILR
jgi:hypothetical protein